MRRRFNSCGFVSMALAVALCQQAVHAQLANPGFEDPVTYDGAPFVGSWEAFSGGAGAVSANSIVTPRSGLQSLELSMTAVDNSFAGAFQDVAGLTPGSMATFSGWHQTTSTLLGVASEYRIEWRNSANINVELSRVQLTQSPTLNQYTQFSVGGVVPVGADTARVVYAIQTFGGEPNPGNSGVIHLDDMSFVVPEPTSIAVLGAAGVVFGRRRR